MASSVYSHLSLSFEGWDSLTVSVTIYFCMCMSVLFVCMLASLFTIVLEAQKMGWDPLVLELQVDVNLQIGALSS